MTPNFISRAGMLHSGYLVSAAAGGNNGSANPIYEADSPAQGDKSRWFHPDRKPGAHDMRAVRRIAPISCASPQHGIPQQSDSLGIVGRGKELAIRADIHGVYVRVVRVSWEHSLRLFLLFGVGGWGQPCGDSSVYRGMAGSH